MSDRATSPAPARRLYRLALIGFGTVGQGLAEIIAERGEALAQATGAELRIDAVVDPRYGGIASSRGFAPEALLDAARQGSFRALPAERHDLDAVTAIRDAQVDVVAEMSFTDLTHGEPGTSHVRAALEAGRHVVTTNKGPIALHDAELADLAAANGVTLGAEGTVMSGTPTLGLGTEQLAGAGVVGVTGILNGTTNYMLGRMEAGLSFDEALAEAQQLGYAEADPSGDVDGVDAAGKAVILANRVMNARLGMADVARRGIRDLTADDMRAAADAGEVWKLLTEVRRDAGEVRAEVGPVRLSRDHPLAAVGGAVNACTFSTELLGDVTLVGPGAGRMETGYALIHDLLAIHRRETHRLGDRP